MKSSKFVFRNKHIVKKIVHKHQGKRASRTRECEKDVSFRFWFAVKQAQNDWTLQQKMVPNDHFDHKTVARDRHAEYEKRAWNCQFNFFWRFQRKKETQKEQNEEEKKMKKKKKRQ